LQYDDEDEESGGRHGKKKKSGGRGFLIEEAEVDTDVEDEEEWEEGAEELINDKGRSRGGILDDDMDRQEGNLHSHRRLQMMLERKPDEIEDYYRRKYADPKSDHRGFRGDAGDLEANDDIHRQTLLPSVK
jgi:transcription elongation factor SPT5